MSFTHPTTCSRKRPNNTMTFIFSTNFSQSKIADVFYLSLTHWCMVVYINVPQQQNIFFSWMNRPSDDSSRRIIPVQFWEDLHTFKYFFLKLKIQKPFFFFFFWFLQFFWIFKNFVTRFNPEKASEEGRGKYPRLS